MLGTFVRLLDELALLCFRRDFTVTSSSNITYLYDKVPKSYPLADRLDILDVRATITEKLVGDLFKPNFIILEVHLIRFIMLPKSCLSTLCSPSQLLEFSITSQKGSRVSHTGLATDLRATLI
jgi:hypothetical protein